MSRTIIIAEAGVNHNGDLNMAKELIDAAATAGADYCKFQTFVPELNISAKAPKAEYQLTNTGNSETQLEMVRKLALSANNFLELRDYCKAKSIGFLSTGFDIPSLDLLRKLGIPFFKIPSGEITNLVLLRKIALFNAPVILSTGMATLGEIEDVVNYFLNNSRLTRDEITILHCNTEYPTPMEDVNLSAMQTIAMAFKTKVGYSDHTVGIEVPIAAVAMGATLIEKHLTLDCSLPGPDHIASLEPKEFKAMVSAIRNIELAIGSGVKESSASEMKNKSIARKSIVAKGLIKKGEMLTDENLGTKRPGNGISPMRWDEVVGTIAKHDFEPDQMIIL